MFKEHYQYIRENVKFESSEPSPTKWIEKNRYVQPHVSEKMFGKFDFKNVPYMRQIVEHLSSYDPVTHITLMKGVRTGGTFGLVHNGVPYIMSERPTNMMMLSANEGLSKKTVEGIDFGIDGCNIRHLIGKASKARNNAKGDTGEEKFFSGGFKLMSFGGQSATNMRQVTAGFIVADELDAFKGFDKSSGNFLELMEDRTVSYGDSKKIAYISSPLLESSSLIYALYLEGNQNVYYVHCPKCGAMIELVWNERNENNTRYGVIFDVRNGEVIKKSVRYRCGEVDCENDFEEKKKTKYEMLNNGIWIPQIERDNKNRVSYRISALYAPPSMNNWFDYAVKFQKAHPRNGVRDQGAWQSFQNSTLGWPYKPSGIEIKSTKLQKNRREYKINEVPFKLSAKDGNEEIILIKLSCDLNGYENDGRLDYEIEADSKSGPSYSIDAGSVGTFIPKIERIALEKEGINVAKLEVERKKYTYQFDKENSIWTEFEKVVFQKFGKNKTISINIVCVDIGHMQDYALEFVRRMKQKNVNCLGVKGAKIEEFTAQSNTDLGKIYNLDSSSTFYLLNVNVIKNKLSSYLDSNSYVDDNGQLHQDLNFMNYPEHEKDSIKYTVRNFFAHFEAEHRIEKKSEGGQTKFLWEKKKTGIQNHFWDVSVYNKFARIFMINLICSNDNPYKKLTYKNQKIEANWENACRLVLEARNKRNVVYE